jgi:hypothetical protein
VVANAGMASKTGMKNMAKINKIATMKEANPVRPPSAIPSY